MVTLNKIYTKTGDDGTTALIGGERRAKYDLRIAAYGTVDEANACIGLARLHTSAMGDLDGQLARIQNDLFDLGADLANPDYGSDGGGDDSGEIAPLRITAEQVASIEAAIDDLNSALQPLKSFVLPGGSPASAHLHHARTVVRRSERLAVELGESEAVNGEAIRYLNRLSDFLFVAARAANSIGRDDVLWAPGANREG